MSFECFNRRCESKQLINSLLKEIKSLLNFRNSTISNNHIDIEYKHVAEKFTTFVIYGEVSHELIKFLAIKRFTRAVITGKLLEEIRASCQVSNPDYCGILFDFGSAH